MRHGGWLLPALALFVLYPFLMLLLATPHQLSRFILHDTWPSFLNFIPHVEVLRQQLLHNHQALWSPMRETGLPIPAGEIQGAPFFPLTLALIWLPQAFFWPVFGALRLAGIAFFAFAIARRLMRFESLAAFAFMLTFGFATYHMRWMNHAWINGLLAVLFYLYFCGRVLLEDNAPWNSVAGLSGMLGVAVGVMGLATCGFPESSVMGALLSAFVLTPLLVRRLLLRDRGFWKNAGAQLIVGHVVGVALGLPQILAMTELVRLGGTTLRSSVALNKYGNLLHFFSPMLMRFGSPLSLGPVANYFGLIPTTFFCLGILARSKKRAAGAFAIGAITCAAFIILKNADQVDWLTRLIAALPVLKDTYFIYYTFTIFLWFFAYFVACGVDRVQQDLMSERSRTGLWLKAIVIYLGLGLGAYSQIHAGFDAIDKAKVWQQLLLWVILLSAFFLPVRRARMGVWLIGLILLSEVVVVRSPMWLGEPSFLAEQREQAARTAEKLQSLGISLSEVREHTGTGAFLTAGINSMDGGYPLITERQSRFRTTLFTFPPGEYKGVFPAQEPKRPDSWRMASVNLHLLGEIPELIQYTVDPAGMQTLVDFGKQKSVWDGRALSRAYQPAACRLASSETEAGIWLASEKELPLGTVALETPDRQEQALCAAWRGPYRQVGIQVDHGNEVQLASVDGPAILVLNDTYYPGWFARDEIANQSLAIRPANVAFRALVLPEKRKYRIDFSYEPNWWRYSRIPFWIATLAALSALSSILFQSFFRRNPAQKFS